MSYERFSELIHQLCATVGLGDPQGVLERGWLEVDGFEARFAHHAADQEALYLTINFGALNTQRVLRAMRMMLESNLTLYAQDQSQLGLEPETGTVFLSIRTTMGEDVDGKFLLDTCTHYTEHGRYWRDNISNSADDAFNGLCEGRYMWLKT